MNLPTWSPPLAQDSLDGPVYFADESGIRYNVYSLNYQTTYTLHSDSYNLVDTNSPIYLSPAITNVRSTLIGVVPLISITSNNGNTPILYSFPTNSEALTVITLDKEYKVKPQLTTSGTNSNGGSGVGAIDVGNEVNENNLLSYRHVLIINGVYDSLGGYSPSLTNIQLPMEITQMSSAGFLRKTINLPITITRSLSNIAIKPFDNTGGAYSISDIRNKTRKYTIVNGVSSQSLTPEYMNGIITLEYINGTYDLSFAEFATTTRRNVKNGELDYTNVFYYITKRDQTVYDISNEYIEISYTRIIIKKATYNANNLYDSIPIKFYQAPTPLYNKSIEEIGEPSHFAGRTIKIKILKSMPRFEGQTPTNNNDNPLTIYRLPDLNKMTTEAPFVIPPPISSNTDSSSNFLISSSNEDVISITQLNGVFTARIYLDGVSTITVTQFETNNFIQKSATFNINVFKITPAIINCNTNVFYTNPYNRQFWTRFTPPCRNSDLYDTFTNLKLTPTQVDQVYDMRRKTEILKYNKNVGGLTKSQKYAKASRGELMRQIGNENKYLSQSIGTGGAGGAGLFTLVCPSTPETRSRLQCGLTSACGVPGKERVLCYDPSVNLYNYKKTYEYKAGLQLTSNIPTTALTAPTNFVISDFDIINNRITLKWDAPDSNGGFPITGYVITYSINNKTWDPYTSILPNGPTSGSNVSYNPISGELNGNTVVFEKKPGSVEIRMNTIYYLSVFSGNERGLSSVPATLTFKTSSVPSIITNFTFTDDDERKNLMIDIKWTDPSNLGTSVPGGYYGPQITSYNLYYRDITSSTWNKINFDTTTVIPVSSSSAIKRYILRNVENEKRYQLKIEPLNVVGAGPESSIITARTLMKPAAPINVNVRVNYGLLPPTMTDISRNYIIVNWDEPNDNGGVIIKSYSITVTNVDVPGVSQTFTRAVSSTNTNKTFTQYINRLSSSLNSNYIGDGTYSVVISAYNGYLRSESSALVNAIVLPTSAKPTIFNMNGYYNAAGLNYVDLIFIINNEIATGIFITGIRVNGLNTSYSTLLNIYNQPITGTGEHIIRIPKTYNSDETIIVGNTYNITLTINYSSGVESTSETFIYTPEIKYIIA
jgi:hypothetical protein